MLSRKDQMLELEDLGQLSKAWDGVETTEQPNKGDSVIVTTTNEISGYQIKEYKGIAHGLILRTMSAGEAIDISLAAFARGVNQPASEFLETVRQNAYDAMTTHALKLGANAIIGMRFETRSINEFFCYGTAVVIEPLNVSSEDSEEINNN